MMCRYEIDSWHCTITLVEEVSSGMDETVGKKTAAGMQKNGIHRMKVADTVSRLTMQSECLRMS